MSHFRNGERCSTKTRVNASNEDDLDEVETEFQQIEEKIEVNRLALLEPVKEVQDYLAKQVGSEMDEARQLKAEQDELETHEQQLLNVVKNDEDDDEANEQERQSLNEQLKNSVQGQESLTGSPTPTPT